MGAYVWAYVCVRAWLLMRRLMSARSSSDLLVIWVCARACVCVCVRWNDPCLEGGGRRRPAPQALGMTRSGRGEG